MHRRVRDERGIALPSPVAVLSVAAIAVAGVVFVTTDGSTEPPAQAAAPATASVSPSPAARSTAPEPVLEEKPEPEKKKQSKPAVRRADVYVEVYNNSGISGLAGSTASRMSGAGWQVVGSDNWYGTIPASTVYYPERLHRAAKLLAKDLGIARTKPAISPMRFDRLTVILTSDYA